MVRFGPQESCLRDHANLSWRKAEPDQRYRLAYSEFFDQKYTYDRVNKEGWICQSTDEEAFGKPWWTNDFNPACLVFSVRLLGSQCAAFWELPVLERAGYLNALNRATDFGDAYYGHIAGIGEIVLSFEILETMP